MVGYALSVVNTTKSTPTRLIMLRRVLPLALFALLLLPAAAFASEKVAKKEYVTEFFIGLIILVIALLAVVAGFEARKANRKSH